MVLAVALAVGVTVLAAPVAGHTQSAEKVYRVGLLWTGTAAEISGRTLRTCLHDLGWVEGKNLVIERGDADGRPERLP